MEDELSEMCKKILNDINAILLKDPQIDEYDVIPTVENTTLNRSPILHEEHKLGVESWCIKPLYLYCYSAFMQQRGKMKQTKRLSDEDVQCLLTLSRVVLMVQADCMTAWNIRKELIEAGRHQAVEDLTLSALILTKHPKSPETFAHRKWLLERIVKLHDATLNDSVTIDTDADTPKENHTDPIDIDDEIRVCQAAADRYPNNYNAWSHRIWVVQTLAKHQLKVCHQELQLTEKWIYTHVSDHSGFHYRQFLLQEVSKYLRIIPRSSESQTLIDCKQMKPYAVTSKGLDNQTIQNIDLEFRCASDCAIDCAEGCANDCVLVKNSYRLMHSGKGHEVLQQLLHREVNITTYLIEHYPGHEAVWCHRRSIISLLIKNSKVNTESSPTEEIKAKIQKVDTGPEQLIMKEKTFAEQLMEGSNSTWQTTLAERYTKWIDNLSV